MTKVNIEPHPSSFRDPSGFLFVRNDILYRQVNISYRNNYDLLMNSGLYDSLRDKYLLIPHEEVEISDTNFENGYKTIQPEELPLISYPYEWCFSQLKDAALATLQIQKIAMAFGMTLKDASAYNIQFSAGKPLLIDTLSFEKYNEGDPWVGYRQFCQHFLSPIVLISKLDARLSQLLRVYIDGIPLDLVSSLLPFRTRFNFSLLTHIHMHAKAQKRYEDMQINAKTKVKKGLSKFQFLAIIDSLTTAIQKIKWRPSGTEWGDYYDDTNYDSEAESHKKRIVAEFIATAKPRSVWDLGGNTGVYSRFSSDNDIFTVSYDIDPAAVEKNYQQMKHKEEKNILPLIIDLTNPTSNIGWANEERMSFMKRGPVDMVFALALIHHLAISNNVPINRIAKFFYELCVYLIIEFVPKSDSQLKRLLVTRNDIFPNYNKYEFENAFKKYFTIEKSECIANSDRTIYLMKAK